MVAILVGTIMNALFIASITASLTVFVIDEAANPERSRKVSIGTLIFFLWAGLKMVASRYKGSAVSNTRVIFHLRANHITRILLPPMVITPLVKKYTTLWKKKPVVLSLFLSLSLRVQICCHPRSVPSLLCSLA